MAGSLTYPTPLVDSNSPSVWVNHILQVYTSTGVPMRISGTGLNDLQPTESPVVASDHYPLWIESVWRDAEGTLYAWYHHEPRDVCSGGKLTAPQIGALISEDDGATFRDLGIILSTGDALNCGAANGYFAGGHGDFSVVLDRQQQYFYFLFGNYSGPLEHQGVAIARMAFRDRANPVGAVQKFYGDSWEQPGLGGLVSPVFPATASWEDANADALWGPSVQWNTHLNTYIAVMNHSCCETGWPQEGIYISVNDDLSDPAGWSRPVKILDASDIGFAPGYYPQVVGLEGQETDSLAGSETRLFVSGISHWGLTFLTGAEVLGRGLPPTIDSPDPARLIPLRYFGQQ